MVEWKKLGEVCEVLRGRALSKKDVGQGDYPIILYGELYTTYGDYIDEIKSYTSQEKASEATKLNFLDLILPVSSTTKEAQIGKVSVVRTKMNVSLGSDAIILRNSSNPSFLMYYLNSKLFEQMKMNCVSGTTIMHLSPSKLVNNKIPIPSLSEQERIVGILDTFTSAIDNLKAQIAQRRKQYEFYRDQLLDLEGKEGVEMKKLGEISKVLRGKRLTKNLLNDYSPYPVFHGGIEPLGYYEQYNRDSNTVMVINVGASAGTVGYCDRKFWSSDGCFCISHSKLLNDKLLFYYLETKKHYLQSQVRHAGIPTLDNPVIEKLPIPLLSLDVQSRIVSILDTFESSIQNLEAQLKQREKQYEYYRNKLLTFEKE